MPGSGVSPLLEILTRRGPQDLNWVGEGYLPWLGGYITWLGLQTLAVVPSFNDIPPLSKVGTPLVKVDGGGGVCILGRG